MATESELIAALSQIFQQPPAENLIIDIGDDGAVFESVGKIVAVADMSVEDVHFKREWSSLSQIGAKITAANLADIFAMGGEPTYLLITAGLPRGFSVDEMHELALGIHSEAQSVGARVIGGDLSTAEKITISIPVLGRVVKPITRSGASVGQRLVVSGLPGWSAAGYSVLTAPKSSSHTSATEQAISSHLKPTVQYRRAREMAVAGVSSMIDISDGLLSEAGHLCRASAVGIVVDAQKLSQLPDFLRLKELAMRIEENHWEWILAGGEDHLFLATIDAQQSLPNGVYEIGETVAKIGVQVSGLEELGGIYDGTGYRHFG